MNNECKTFTFHNFQYFIIYVPLKQKHNQIFGDWVIAFIVCILKWFTPYLAVTIFLNRLSIFLSA